MATEENRNGKGVVTKDDLKIEIAKIDLKIEQTKLELLKWFIGLFVTLSLMIFGLYLKR